MGVSRISIGTKLSAVVCFAYGVFTVFFGVILASLALHITSLGPGEAVPGKADMLSLAVALLVIVLGLVGALAGAELWNKKKKGGLLALLYSAITLAYGAFLVFGVQTISLMNGIMLFSPIVAMLALLGLNWKNLN